MAQTTYAPVLGDEVFYALQHGPSKGQTRVAKILAVRGTVVDLAVFTNERADGTASTVITVEGVKVGGKATPGTWYPKPATGPATSDAQPATPGPSTNPAPSATPAAQTPTTPANPAPIATPAKPPAPAAPTAQSSTPATPATTPATPVQPGSPVNQVIPNPAASKPLQPGSPVEQPVTQGAAPAAKP